MKGMNEAAVLALPGHCVGVDAGRAPIPTEDCVLRLG